MTSPGGIPVPGEQRSPASLPDKLEPPPGTGAKGEAWASPPGTQELVGAIAHGRDLAFWGGLEERGSQQWRWSAGTQFPHLRSWGHWEE